MAIHNLKYYIDFLTFWSILSKKIKDRDYVAILGFLFMVALPQSILAVGMALIVAVGIALNVCVEDNDTPTSGKNERSTLPATASQQQLNV